MKNCRNCKFADWEKVNGRRRFRVYAECTYESNINGIPASAKSALISLEKKRSVASYKNEEVQCRVWEKLK